MKTSSINEQRRRALQLGAGAMAALSGAWPLSALAKGTYDPGASDKEIKLGNLHPYSGPASAYGTCGRAFDAYFKMINATGGVNERQIRSMTCRVHLQGRALGHLRRDSHLVDVFDAGLGGGAGQEYPWYPSNFTPADLTRASHFDKERIIVHSDDATPRRGANNALTLTKRKIQPENLYV